jgi:CheY-like chemotaxis protein
VPDIDLLFVDVMMPNGMSGRDCAEQAKALRPGLKVLFASGYFEGALVQRGDMDEAPSSSWSSPTAREISPRRCSRSSRERDFDLRARPRSGG